MDAQSPKDRILEEALGHVAFDGWSEATFLAAARDAGVTRAMAEALYPRGGLDLALAYHRRGDAQMVAALAQGLSEEMRLRERIAHAVMVRLSFADREAVRRGTTLFTLPPYAPEGAKAIWGTADAIWTALGDRSDDLNYYSKRASLSAIYGATVLFWLGDDSPAHEETKAFLDRRIAGVMQFEKAKAQLAKGPLGKLADCGPLRLLRGLRPPADRSGLPGRQSPRPF